MLAVGNERETISMSGFSFFLPLHLDQLSLSATVQKHPGCGVRDAP